MSDVALIHLINALRLFVAIEWSVIGVMGGKALVRIVSNREQRGDMICTSLGFIGVGLIIFQWQAFVGAIPPQPNEFFAIALFCFAISGIFFFAQRVVHAPKDHQRAILVTQSLVMVTLFAAGALS